MARLPRGFVLSPWLIGIVLAAPPSSPRRDAPGDVMPRRLWDITHLDLDVRIDIEQGSLSGITTHTLAPLGRPHDRVRLHQIGLDIQSIEVDGEAVSSYRSGPEWIDIPVPPKGDTHQVQITYSATPPLGLHFRSPAAGDRNLAVWSQGEDEDNRYWFPSWDYPNDAFTVDTHITLPDGLLARANGDPAASEPAEPGWTRHSFSLEQPISNYLVALVAGDYRAVTVDGPVPIEIIGPAAYEEPWLTGAADEVDQQIAFFEALLDQPYPYPTYRQAWVERFMYGGMENAALTVLAGRRMVDPAVPGRQIGSDSLIAHELAHQWFGDLLTCYGWRERWLNEGFASYYAHLWLEEKYGPDHAAVSLYNRRQSAMRVTGPLAARAHSFDGEESNGVYVKGASVLHMLRTYLGEDVYTEGIRRYVSENAFRFVESEDLRRALEEVSGEHLGWAFDQWVNGQGMPSWKTRWSHEEGTLTVVLIPTGDPLFHAPVRVEVGTSSGVRTHQLWLGEGPTRLVLDTDSPEWVAINPDAGVLGRFEVEQSTSSWIAQLEHSPSPYAQVEAMHALQLEDPSPEAITALDRVARSGRAPDFRAVALTTLGKLSGMPEARDAVLRASTDAAPTVREAAIDAMANTAGGEPYAARLLEAARTDPDARNRASARIALAKHQPKTAAALARKRLARPDPSHNGVEHSYAADVLMEHGNLADGRALVRFMAPSHPRKVRYAAAQAAIELWKKAAEGKPREALQRSIIDTLFDWLKDPDFRVRSQALRSLQTIGRPQDIDAITAYGLRDHALPHDALVKATVRKIRKPEPAEDPTKALNEKVDALSDRLDEADQRLERLEEWRE